MVEGYIQRSKLIPPQLRPPIHQRRSLVDRLERGLETRFTLVQAGAGYGKSTTVAAFLQGSPEPWAWYSLDERDGEPLIFLAHLIAAVDTLTPGLAHTLQTSFNQARQGELPWGLLLDSLNNHLHQILMQDAWLVLDDFHLMASAIGEMHSLVDHFFTYTPPKLHIFIITRQRLDLPVLTRARARRDLLLINQKDMAFSQEEIEAVFRQHYYLNLSKEQSQRLAEETEGWIMALQLLAQPLRGLQPDKIDAVLADLPRQLDVLFDYLTESVINRLLPAEQRFLFQTAILDELHPEACDAVRRSQDSDIILARLADSGLGLTQISECVYRHHHLVREFLRRSLQDDKRQWRNLHRRAATFFLQKSDWERSIHHLIQAGDFEAAANQLSAFAPTMLKGGRFRTLGRWLTQMPDSLLDEQPDLRLLQGDVARLTSRYQEALTAYQQAEALYHARHDELGRSHALRGQAMIFIDTVRPARVFS